MLFTFLRFFFKWLSNIYVYIIFYILFDLLVLFELFLFGDLEEHPRELTCNSTSACYVRPFDSLVAILDCEPTSTVPSYFIVILYILVLILCKCSFPMTLC